MPVLKKQKFQPYQRNIGWNLVKKKKDNKGGSIELP
jgi:hypothetical protein